MRNQIRLTLIAAFSLATIPFAFQNCAPSFKNLEEEVLSKSAAPTKPQSFILADFGHECDSSTGSDVAVKSEILVSEDGSLLQTIDRCQVLETPKVLPGSAIWEQSMVADLILVRGRVYQLDESAQEGPRVLKADGLAEIFCRWTTDQGLQGEVTLRHVPAANSAARTLDAEVFEEGSTEFNGMPGASAAVAVDVLATAIPGDGFSIPIEQSFSSSLVSVAAGFFGEIVAQGAVVKVNNVVRDQAKCYMAF